MPEGGGRGPFVVTILKGQMISALIAGTGFFASLLSSHDISIPLFLTTVNYSLLIPYIFLRAKLSVLSPWRPWCLSAEEGRVILLGSRAANSAGKEEGSYRSHFRELSCPWWIYALLACVDLEANVIIVSAYRYTSVTSVMLLDCFSIPCVMMLSYLFLKAKYTRTHLIGVFVCLIGMGCIIATDYYSGGGSCDDCSNPFYGDMLCLLGTSLYAVSNVTQEKLVKHKDREECLGMLGSFGVLLGTAQLLLMEIDTLRRVTWTVEIIGFIAGFIFCLNFMYTRASLFLKDCDAALLNLSLLTSDVYAVLFSYFYYGYLVSWLYFLAFGLACTGLAIYSAAPPPTGLSTPRCGEGPDQAHAVDDQSSPFEEEDSASEPQPPFQASYYSVPHSDDQESAF